MLDIADKFERVGNFIEQQRLDLFKRPFAPPENGHGKMALPTNRSARLSGR